MTVQKKNKVPKTLRLFFFIHFILDMGFALPLFAVPHGFLQLLGWQAIDPFTARLVAAALFGIGLESLIGIKAGFEVYRGMLNLKIIWSSCAIAGIIITIAEMGSDAPFFAWFVLIVFVLFNVVWTYWRVRLKKTN